MPTKVEIQFWVGVALVVASAVLVILIPLLEVNGWGILFLFSIGLVLVLEAEDQAGNSKQNKKGEE